METADQPLEPSASPVPTPAAVAGATPTDCRTRPTQQGTVYLWTLGVFSTFLLGFQANLAFLLGAFALGCAAVAWLLARGNLRGLRFERDAPRRTRVGAPTRIVWRIYNHARQTRIGLEIEDRPPRGTKPVVFFVEVPVVEQAGEVCCEADATFIRRGDMDLGHQAMQIASRYPLGLFRTRATVAVGGRILVRPREGRVTSALRQRLGGRRAVEARHSQAAGRDTIYGVREYREGDDPRRIHWRTSARRGALTVSEWRAEQGREVIIVLGRGHGAGGTATVHFERAVSAAASIYRACIKEHVRVTLELGDGQAIHTDGSGTGLDRGLDALAHVTPQGSRHPRKALRRLGTREGPRTVVFIEAGREAGLRARLSTAAGRGGAPLVVSAWQASLERWVGGLIA